MDCVINSIPKKDLSTTLDLTYYYSGIQECPSNHYWMGVRDHYFIHFILDGYGKCTYTEQEYNLKKGQAFLARPGQRIHYIADSISPWRYCWVAFSGANSSSLLKMTDFSSGNPIVKFSDPDVIENIIKKLSALPPSMDNRYIVETAYLLIILSKIEVSKKNNDEKTDISKRHMNMAINFIQRNYSGHITVEAIAKHVGINRKYLSSIFKNLLGISTQQYLLNKRMQEATILLTNSDLSIKEIAHSVGYYDPLLFSKMFKKKYGLSPIGFRNRSVINESSEPNPS